jgi:hypothetical protein
MGHGGDASTPLFSLTSPNGGSFTAAQIREKAGPLLTCLSAGREEVSVTAQTGGLCDGGTGREWCVISASHTSRSAPGCVGAHCDQCSAELSPEMAEVRYDGDTGGLIYASSTFGMHGQSPSVSRAPLTSSEAIEVARAWLPKLGLANAQKQREPGKSRVSPPIVFPPQKSSAGLWRVWLRGQETPGGPPLTVQISLTDATGEFLFAAVVERAAAPMVYLPRRVSPQTAPSAFRNH